MTQAPEAVEAQGTKRLVIRNTLFLVLGQVLGSPLSFVMNAMMARYLGPEEFGVLYIAQTFSGFGFLAVDWGQNSVLPAQVARDRSRAGEVLGSALAWRATSAPTVYALLALSCWVLGYNKETQICLALVCLGGTINAFAFAYQEVDRGFERTELVAYRGIGYQALAAAICIPTLLLGGRLTAVLVGQGFACFAMLVFVWRSVQPRVGRVAFRLDALKALLNEGSGFMALGLIAVLQPNIDAVILSKLAPGDPVGWYAAARKLIGVLIFPAAAIVGAAYPTLCRLYADNEEDYRNTSGAALRLVTIIVVPVAVGCGVYPMLAIQLFSKHAYAPAADILRVLSPFVLLVYFTMIVSTILTSASLQKPWAWAQTGCIVISAALDPFLVPWFQHRSGNGGMGVAVTSLLSEILMLVSGLWLVPKGILNRKLFRELVLCLFAGGAMIVAAMLLDRIGLDRTGLTGWIGAPITVLVYVGCLFATGGLNAQEVAAFRNLLRRSPK